MLDYGAFVDMRNRYVPYRTEVGCAGRVRQVDSSLALIRRTTPPTHRRGATTHSGRPRPRAGRAIPASARPPHLDAGSNIAARETALGEESFVGLFIAT